MPHTPRAGEQLLALENNPADDQGAARDESRGEKNNEVIHASLGGSFHEAPA